MLYLDFTAPWHWNTTGFEIQTSNNIQVILFIINNNMQTQNIVSTITHAVITVLL